MRKIFLMGLLVLGFSAGISETKAVETFGQGVTGVGSALNELSNVIDGVGNIAESVDNLGKAAGGAPVYHPPVFQGVGLQGGADLTEYNLDGGISKEHNLKKVIVDWTNWLLPLAALLAVVGIVWAGFLYITSFGDDGRMDQAKNIIIWVVVGILVILSAYAIVNTVMNATHQADEVKFSSGAGNPAEAGGSMVESRN